MTNCNASAKICGGEQYPQICGKVFFRQTPAGVMVTAEIHNLPKQGSGCFGVFGLHIHEGKCCRGNSNDEFADAGGHYNPGCEEHPYHAGDLPPLFSNGGYAYMQVLTDRFNICDIIGRTVIIHSMPDDFTTQPSGNSGKKIACGKIERA